MKSTRLSIDLSDSLEKVAVQVFRMRKSGSAYVAQQVAELIREKQQKGLIVCWVGNGFHPLPLCGAGLPAQGRRIVLRM